MIFDVLFGDIFSSLNEIILKICEDLPIGLSQLSEKLDIMMKMRQKTLFCAVTTVYEKEPYEENICFLKKYILFQKTYILFLKTYILFQKTYVF